MLQAARVTTAKTLPYALAFGLLAGACGDDNKPLPDVTPMPMDEVDAGANPTDEVDAAPVEPCPTQAVEGADLAGLWHVKVTFDGAFSAPAPFVFEETEDGYVVYTGGGPSMSSAFEDGVLVASWRFDFGGGNVRTATVRFANIDCNGILSGTAEQCFNENCGGATFSGAKVEPLDEPESEGISLITAYAGPDTGAWREGGMISYNVRARGDLAYVARDNGLRIVDISDPKAPRERGFIAPPQRDAGEFYNDVKLLDGPNNTLYAVMASNLRGGVVIDVTDPDNPLEVTTFPAARNPKDTPSVHTLFIEGTRAYVAYNTTNAVLVFDLADPANPQELGGYLHPGLADAFSAYLHDLYVKDGRAYLNYWSLGMSIVDLQDPANPVLVGEYVDYGGETSHSNWVTEVGGRRISIHGDEEYGAHARIVDVDPASPTFLDTLSEYETRPQVSIHNILAHENLAFVTYYQDGLRVLDVSDPANPVKIAHYHTWHGYEPGYGRMIYEGAIGLDYNPETKTIYVADTHRGLFVLRLDVAGK